MSKLIHRMQDALGQMTGRERKLVIGGSGTMVLFIIGGVIWFAWSQVKSLEADVEGRKDALRSVQMLALDHQANLEKASRIREILEKNRTTTMQSFVEKKAAEVGIQRDRLDSIKEKSPVTKGELEEKAFTVVVSKLTLEDAMNFIHTLEVSNYPMVIRSANFKTRKRKTEKLIRLTLEIAAFRSVAAATTGGE